MPWISLDLDGTLAAWPFGRAVLAPLRAELDAAGATPAMRAEYLRRLASDMPVTAFDWDEMHRLVRSEYGLTPLRPLAELATPERFAPELVYDDTRPALERLRAGGWRVALATNGLSHYQNVALAALQLTGFEATLTPDTTGFVKPQAGFLRALRDLSGDADALESMVHAGDLVAQDVLAANRAAVRAAWVWRDMPEGLRAVDVTARAADGGVIDVIRDRYEHELEHDGRIADEYDALPRPDLVVADLLELALALAPAAPSPERAGAV